MGVDQFGDFSKTQRTVLLIDLNPLLHLQNPTPYLTSVLFSAKTLLSFLPLSSSSHSLFAFKFFCSSLSPLLSSSKLNCLIPGRPLCLSFDHSSSTFESLSSIFDSILAGENPLADSLHPKLLPQASCLAASMRQLLYDYTWDPIAGDATSGLSSGSCDFLGVRSNLVVLFSQFCKSVYSLTNFLNVGEEEVCLNNLDSFAKCFCGSFESVNDAFISRDIQCSWVDVQECTENCEGCNESESIYEFFKSGIMRLGWGCSSTDSIILGSSIVPFGLIYPRIGISSRVFDHDECSKKVQAKLSLEIRDTKGKPLECKSCDLQLVQMKNTGRTRSCDFIYNPEILTHSNEHEKDPTKFIKLHVKAVQDQRGYDKWKGRSYYPIVVSEFFGDSGKNKTESSAHFFADKVLNMLAVETSGHMLQKQFPIWQIFLSFLYKEGYFAMVTISNGNENNTYMGVLRPFTISSALLFIIDDEFHPPKMDSGSGGGNLDRSTDSICVKPDVYSEKTCGFVDSDSGPSTFILSSQETDGKCRKGKKCTNLCLGLTWNVFCQAAYENCKLDLGEVYFRKGCKSSKRLKFFKCWMKQIKKSSFYSLNSQKSELDKIPKGAEDKVIRLPQESESEEPISTSASVEGNSMVEASRILDEASPCLLETSLSFFGDLSNKIRQGIESEAVDLGALAERLVNSSIYWLSQRESPDPTTSESRVSSKNSYNVHDDDDDDEMMLSTLTKLLLRELKDMAANHKNNNQSSSASDTVSSGLASKNLVREYELQILFRMEVLKSEIGGSVGVSVKHKFIKHICLFLETIQCQMEGGFFGDWSLEIYLDRIIKSRYSDILGDIVHKIYAKMDLLLFNDEDEAPIHIPNSEDSNHSCREKPERDEMGENHNLADQRSIEETTLEENEYISFNLSKEQSYKLLEAQERRDRARRFASFTSWVPDLQRVWAPKQPKQAKKNIDCRLQRTSSKRKDYEDASFDMVCETPNTEKRRSCSRVSGSKGDYLTGFGDNSSRSVSKVLFKDKD